MHTVVRLISLAAFAATILVTGLTSLATAQVAAERSTRDVLNNFGAITQLIGGTLGVDLSSSGLEKVLLLEQESVLKELELTEKQKTQVKEKLEALPEMISGRKRDDGDDFLDTLKALAGMGRHIDRMLDTVLRDAQSRRLRQISLQQRGSQAFADPDVQGQLSLTRAQQSQIATILFESQSHTMQLLGQSSGEKKTPELFGLLAAAMDPPPPQAPSVQPVDVQTNSDPASYTAVPDTSDPDQQKKRANHAKVTSFADKFTECDERLLGVLTCSQLDKWQRMRGEPFSFSLFGEEPKEVEARQAEAARKAEFDAARQAELEAVRRQEGDSSDVFDPTAGAERPGDL